MMTRHQPWLVFVLATSTVIALASCSTPGTKSAGARNPATDLILIPAGEFNMGKDDQGDCGPAHRVELDAFYIAAYEVTNSQYHEYCKATGAVLPEFWGMDEFNCGPRFPHHPVVGISHREARAFAEWAGMRLPTEAEWEYAARGGHEDLNYPDSEEIEPSKASYAVDRIGTGTRPVGSFPANGYGLHDMAGNVFEWVEDRYDPAYYRASPVKNPVGPEEGKLRVIRGGSWHSGPYCLRVYYRNALPRQWRDFGVGFRCAKDAH